MENDDRAEKVRGCVGPGPGCVIISLRNFGQLCLVISCPAPDVAGPTQRFIQMRNVPDQHCLPWDTKVPCITFYGPGCRRTSGKAYGITQTNSSISTEDYKKQEQTERAGEIKGPVCDSLCPASSG